MNEMSDSEMVPEAPAVAYDVFPGESFAPARTFAELLAGPGVVRGLLGPREVPRIWDRHVLNCAVVSDLFPPSARVVDVGSGAGLPGIPLALRRPDLRIDLVEPLQRRCTFLTEVVDALELGNRVQVVHGRAEERSVQGEVGDAAWVTARAVAPLDRLAGWCLPLLGAGGTLVALKGERAEAEI